MAPVLARARLMESPNAVGPSTTDVSVTVVVAPGSSRTTTSTSTTFTTLSPGRTSVALLKRHCADSPGSSHRPVREQTDLVAESIVDTSRTPRTPRVRPPALRTITWNGTRSGASTRSRSV
jgi:hypothetical protein